MFQVTQYLYDTIPSHAVESTFRWTDRRGNTHSGLPVGAFQSDIGHVLVDEERCPAVTIVATGGAPDEGNFWCEWREEWTRGQGWVITKDDMP